MKSTVDEIRQRFDADVQRFSNLETGQQAAVDSPECLELISEAATLCTPNATDVMDIGCGAGNYTLRYLHARRSRWSQAKNSSDQKESMPPTERINCLLVDLSEPMLVAARRRVADQTQGTIQTIQHDIRDLARLPVGPKPGNPGPLTDECVDVIMAAAVFHHLRTPDEWSLVFQAVYRWLRPGGGVWIYDMVESPLEPWRQAEKRRYGEYLQSLGGDEYREQVFAYIKKEDTPAPLSFQLDLLKTVGFAHTEVLHKRMGFAAFGAVKQ